MNILFYTTFQISETKGGTERISLSLAKVLTKFYNYQCYSMYLVADSEVPECDTFSSNIATPKKIDTEWLIEILKKYNIDVIINQGVFALMSVFRQASNVCGCKLVLCHHFEPGWEINFKRVEHYIDGIFKPHSFRSWLGSVKGLFFYPFYMIMGKQQLAVAYHKGYDFADAVVLLSESFKDQFCKYSNIKECSKLRYIPNMLSYECFLPIEQIYKKEKIVLIVSRLDEVQKRLCIALDIWNEVKKYGESKDWKLQIVGHGDDEKKYKKYVFKKRIPDVEFLGRQDPKHFYEHSSLFMLTSRSEGWGLTLTEAQQFGCVPLAFDSYASLHDIIIEGKNGFIVPNNSIHEYVECILRLMIDTDLRYDMGKKSIDLSRRFEPIIVGSQWNNLLQSIVNA